MTPRLASAVALSFATFAPAAFGQDYFPSQIPRGPLTVGIRDFARLPNPSTNTPARASVMTRDPLGRLVVNDQHGPIYTIGNNGSNVTEYLDVRDFAGVSLVSGGERGVQSVAFHPDFNVVGSAGFGRLYTLHSSTNTSPTPDFDTGSGTAHHEVLLEWRTSNPTAATFVPANPAAPYREVMRLDEPFDNHNGGLISFNTSAAAGSADRTNLYVAIGDGGSANDPLENGQNTATPYGKILRIDPTGSNSANGKYGIVAANAFAGDGNGGTLAEVYAYGLRNPQRFGWDDANGRMFTADIGQAAVEEINLITNGGNYGWDQREGSFPFEGASTPGMIGPVAEYDHTNIVAGLSGVTGNRAVTMGEIVRGSSIPGLDGKLLFGDFPSGVLFYLDADADPLDGGQDGIRELAMLDSAGNPVRLLQLINAERASKGLGAVTRADLRFSLGTEGEVYVTNKQDNVIRVLVAVPEPTTLALLGGLLATTLRRRRR